MTFSLLLCCILAAQNIHTPFIFPIGNQSAETNDVSSPVAARVLAQAQTRNVDSLDSNLLHALAGNTEKLIALGRAYEFGKGDEISKNLIASYAFYNLAASRGSQQGRLGRNRVKKEMSVSQLSTAQKLSRWIISISKLSEFPNCEKDPTGVGCQGAGFTAFCSNSKDQCDNDFLSFINVCKLLPELEHCKGLSQ